MQELPKTLCFSWEPTLQGQHEARSWHEQLKEMIWRLRVPDWAKELCSRLSMCGDMSVACAEMEEKVEAAWSSEAAPDSMAARSGAAPEIEAAAAAQEDSPVEPEQDWDDVNDDGDEGSLPSFEFRVETAKLLIELDEGNDAATQVRS